MNPGALMLIIISLLITGAFFMAKRIGVTQCQQEVSDAGVKQIQNVTRETAKAMSLSDRALADGLRAYTRGKQAPTVFTPTGSIDP